MFYTLTADGQRLVATVTSTGQGIGLSKVERDQVEEWAMTAVERHCRGKRYKTERHGRPFDLLCWRGKKELRVEVKGTTGSGASVLVTIGEVKSARAYTTDLFVLSEIELTAKGPKGGRKTVISPWKADDSQLIPRSFSTPPRPPPRSAAASSTPSASTSACRWDYRPPHDRQ